MYDSCLSMAWGCSQVILCNIGKLKKNMKTIYKIIINFLLIYIFLVIVSGGKNLKSTIYILDSLDKFHLFVKSFQKFWNTFKTV